MGYWDLPENWSWSVLGDEKICTLNMGQSPPGNTYNDSGDGFPFFQGKTDFGEIYPSIRQWCSAPRKISDIGDVLISVRAPVGPTNLTAEKCAIGRGLAALKPSDNVETKYLLYALRSVESQIASKGSGSTFHNITKANLALIQIPIPYPDDPARSLAEQRRIVARLEAIFTELRESQRLNDAIRADTDRVMEAFVSEFASGFPSSRIPLIDVLQSRPRNGWSPKVSDNPSGTPVLRLGAVLHFEYDPGQVKYTDLPTASDAHYWLEPGDIMISRSNTLNLVAHASIYDGRPYPCICPDLLMKMRVKEELADSRFLIYWLSSPEVRKYITSKAKGASPTMKKVNQQDVMNIPFPKISLEEQVAITENLNGLKKEITEMQAVQADDSRNFKEMEHSILNQAFCGEL